VLVNNARIIPTAQASLNLYEEASLYKSKGNVSMEPPPTIKGIFTSPSIIEKAKAIELATDGMILGMSTFKTAWKGDDPKVRAASCFLRSSEENAGSRFLDTKGHIRAVSAITIRKRPPVFLRSIFQPAATIAGEIAKGKLSINALIRFLCCLLGLVIPILLLELD
jgi:hypothetical protein